MLLALVAATPPSPGGLPRPRSDAAPAEVKAWLRQTLASREGHTVHHVRWLEFALGRWFFNTNDGVHGAELWESDLTVDGTRMLRDIRPGPQGSFPHHKCEFRGRLFFAANDGINGVEPWVSDGTPNGTRLFLDLYRGGDSSYAQGLIACGDHLFFAAADATHGFEVWASDGTEAGTRILQDITPGFGSSHISEMLCVDALLYFTIHDTYRWRTDGTRRGTRLSTAADIEAETHRRTEL